VAPTRSDDDGRGSRAGWKQAERSGGDVRSWPRGAGARRGERATSADPARSIGNVRSLPHGASAMCARWPARPRSVGDGRGWQRGASATGAGGRADGDVRSWPRTKNPSVPHNAQVAVSSCIG
jgi:hypothetical protein